MFLSELKVNQKGIIIKIRGRGAFRRRIMEMGFIKGREVEVLRCAPFGDPVEYRIMGYDVSLRLSEASLIDVVTIDELKEEIGDNILSSYATLESEYREKALKRSKVINIGLVGNPNTGKTTFFNFATGSNERVANYSGVTVEAKQSSFDFAGYRFNVTDLPGTYSLSAYSPEEIYVRDYIMNEFPDVLINIVDGANLERNLYLTTQLIDMDVKIVIGLNMYDELEKKGNKLDVKLLSELLGMPVIPTVSSKCYGIKELLNKVIDIYEDRADDFRHIHINYGNDIEESIKRIQSKLRECDNKELLSKYSTRFLALKLLEKDKNIKEKYISLFNNYYELTEKSEIEIKKIEAIYNDDIESIFAGLRYGFIRGAVSQSYIENKSDNYDLTKLLDTILMNRIIGYPVFLFFIWLIFYLTFKLGSYPTDWINYGIKLFSGHIKNLLGSGWYSDMMTDGLIEGLGSVLVFVPNIFILFFLLSFIEDFGYMARIVFLTDKIMHKIGLHGRSFIPLIMGFGCNVPAIMAIKTIENRSTRLLTMAVVPFMSCSARLPVFILLISSFYGESGYNLLFLIYLIGIIIGVLTSILFNKLFFKGKTMEFVMELPPYRFPTLRTVSRHMWAKGREYFKKMSGPILFVTLIIWGLNYFSLDVDKINDYEMKISNIIKMYEVKKKNVDDINYEVVVQRERDSLISMIQDSIKIHRKRTSIICYVGMAIEPVFRPLGFDWKTCVSLLSGVASKEVIISTMSVLYDNDNVELKDKLANYSGLDRSSAFGLILFVLLYIPCMGTFIALKNVSGGYKFPILLTIYTIIIAWLSAFIVRIIL